MAGFTAEFESGKYLNVPFWYVSVAYQARLTSEWVFKLDCVTPKYKPCMARPKVAWSCWYGAIAHRKCTLSYKYQAGGKSISVLFIQQTVHLSEGRPRKVSDVLKPKYRGSSYWRVNTKGGATKLNWSVQYSSACRYSAYKRLNLNTLTNYTISVKHFWNLNNSYLDDGINLRAGKGMMVRLEKTQRKADTQAGNSSTFFLKLPVLDKKRNQFPFVCLLVNSKDSKQCERLYLKRW